MSTHGTLDILIAIRYKTAVELIVCTFQIHELTQKLDRRLRAVHLERWHIQIVDEENLLLRHRRSINPSSSFVQLTIDQFLRS